MITGEIRSKIDRIWDTMWSGGISNPLSVIEQLTYLLFIKRLDELHTLKERKAARTKKPVEEPVFGRDQDHLRWSRFKETAPQVFLPPIDHQNRFATIVQSIETQKTRLRAHLAELDTLFASLQSRAFNGEL